MDKIHHVISAGLEKGRYYRVYVTQVNKSGNESPRSAPSLIRVGDVYPPPVPVLSVDTSEFSNGCYADGDTITVMLKWTVSECDDLDSYIIYQASKVEGFTGSGIYTSDSMGEVELTRQAVLTSGTTSISVPGIPSGKYVYFGIQAVDLSHNSSNVYIIKVDAEDLTQVTKPKSPITVTPYGIWALKVSTPCPQYSNIATVVFYRDGWKQLPPIQFHKGLEASLVDALDAIDGLTHFYTYLYITKDGRKSPMSDPSATATASPIDLTYIDTAVIEALKKAWQTDDISSTTALIKAASKQAQQVQELYKQLKDVTDSYNALYNDFTVAANEIKLLSAKVEEQDGKLKTYGTSIEQNAKDIVLRATKGDIDSATGQLKDAMVSMINVQADRITSVVADTSKISSSITQMNNAIDLKVSSNDLTSRIAVAIQNGISVAYIKASRIVLDGQMLLQGNAKLTGRLYASDISLVNNDGSIAWGTGQDVKPATITIGDQGWRRWDNNTDWKIRKFASFNFTPRPSVTFNGVCGVTVTARVMMGVGFRTNNPSRVSMNSNCQPGIVLSTSDDPDFSNGYNYQEWNTDNHPATTFDSSSFDYLGYYNEPLAGGMSHIYTQERTVTLTEMMTIGKAVQLRLWQRLWGRGDNSANLGNNAVVYYRVELINIECR